MGGQIDAYIDCLSLYSYFALVQLLQDKPKLEEHGVTINIHPVLIAGVNVGSGNKPPWMLPAKAKYYGYDLKHAKVHFNLPRIRKPDNFPIVSLLPERCMIYVKDNFPVAKYEECFLALFVAMWEDHRDLSKPDQLAATLSKHLEPEEIEKALQAATSSEYKQKLSDNTKEAVATGAFGCPWFIVRNDQGKTEPFFGSDRFHFMWQFLGLPFTQVALQSPSGTSKL